MQNGTTSPLLGVILGAFLVLVGVVATIMTALSHWTSLIPALFGVLLVVLGLMGRQQRRRRPATWGIGILGLLAALGSLGAVGAWADAAGGEPINLVAPIAQTLMLLCGVVLVIAAALDLFKKR